MFSMYSYNYVSAGVQVNSIEGGTGVDMSIKEKPSGSANYRYG